MIITDIANPETLKKIQSIELDILAEFNRICKKYSLQYFAIGGTCIGAVRHQGFIPWDDDIDIAMPYDDYIKFIEVASKELPKQYLLCTPDNCEHLQDNLSKIHDSRTLYIKNSYIGLPDLYKGVFFDIMPIFGMSRNKLMQQIESVLCDLWIYNNRAIRLPYDYSHKTMYKITWKLMRFNDKLFHRSRNCNFYTEKINRYFSRYQLDHSDKIIFGWRKRRSKLIRPRYSLNNVFYAEDFAESIEVPFENQTMQIPKGYDRYLRIDFGEYMKLPPEEKRFSHQNNSILDLDNSFMKYINGELSLPSSE